MRTLYPARYELIDDLRGIAALAVVIQHSGMPGDWYWVRGDAPLNLGQIAVCAFFVISGYCISASANSCLKKGAGFGEFMRRRIRRIYPPYCCALAFWVVTRLVKYHFTGENDLNASWTKWLQNLTLTQWLSLLRNPLQYASDNPSVFVTSFWSLCYEEQFYFVSGLMIWASKRCGFSLFRSTVSLMLVALVWNWFLPSLCYGVFIEYWALFALGALVFERMCRMTSSLAAGAVDVGIAVLLAVSATIQWSGRFESLKQIPPGGGPRSIYAELAVASTFALFLVALRPASSWIARQPWRRPIAALGTITYSLYLIHQFNLKLADGIARKIVHGAFGADSAWSSWFVEIFIHLAMAVVFWRCCERPFLNKPVKETTAAH